MKALCCFSTRNLLILPQNLQFHLLSHHHAATRSWVFNPSSSVWRGSAWPPACWAQSRCFWRGAPAEQVGGRRQGSSSRAVKAGVLSVWRYLESWVRSLARVLVPVMRLSQCDGSFAFLRCETPPHCHLFTRRGYCSVWGPLFSSQPSQRPRPPGGGAVCFPWPCRASGWKCGEASCGEHDVHRCSTSCEMETRCCCGRSQRWDATTKPSSVVTPLALSQSSQRLFPLQVRTSCLFLEESMNQGRCWATPVSCIWSSNTGLRFASPPCQWSYIYKNTHTPWLWILHLECTWKIIRFV